MDDVFRYKPCKEDPISPRNTRLLNLVMGQLQSLLDIVSLSSLNSWKVTRFMMERVSYRPDVRP
jgi:hypothetical protein